MRVFFAALLTSIVLGAAALFAFGANQRTTTTAYTTEGARISQGWSWRRLMPLSKQTRVGQVPNNAAGLNPSGMVGQFDETSGTADACDQSSALGMIFIDFGDTAKDAGCST
jgi:hypothetical protein